MNAPDGHNLRDRLIAQDKVVDSTDFTRVRTQVMNRLGRAQRRESMARCAMLTFLAIAVAGVGFLAAANLGWIGHSDGWPEWLKNIAATTFFLLPVTVLILGAIYLLRHYRELHNARFAVQSQLLADLQHQLEELKGPSKPLRVDTTASQQGRPAGEAESQNKLKRGSSSGFSLLELLAAILIISLLASLGFAALLKAKSQAQRTLCRNNLGQLGRALACYVSEFHFYPGTLVNPLLPGAGTSFSTSEESAFWDDRIAPYLGNTREILHCPNHVLSRRERAYGENYRANYNYGYNALGCDRIRTSPIGQLVAPLSNYGLGHNVLRPEPATGARTTSFAVPESLVRTPADMIALADRKGGDEWTSAVIAPGIPSVQWDDDPGNQHQGAANAVFCDGHIESGPQSEWKAVSVTTRCRWNNDHQAHPEVWQDR